MVSVEKLIGDLEDTLESAWQLPMSGGKSVLDIKRIRKIIEEIRSNLPMEITQAKRIVQDRSAIIDAARSESETILKTAEEKIRSMISNNEITRAAQSKADSIIAEATAKAKEIKISSSEYAANVMKNLDEAITDHLSKIRKARHMFQTDGLKSE